MLLNFSMIRSFGRSAVAELRCGVNGRLNDYNSVGDAAAPKRPINPASSRLIAANLKAVGKALNFTLSVIGHPSGQPVTEIPVSHLRGAVHNLNFRPSFSAAGLSG